MKPIDRSAQSLPQSRPPSAPLETVHVASPPESLDCLQGESSKTPVVQLPNELWGQILRHVPLPPKGCGLGDFKNLRLVNSVMAAEAFTAHRELADRSASEAAKRFLRSGRRSLDAEEVQVLASARSLHLRYSLGWSPQSLRTIFEQTPLLRSLDFSNNDVDALNAGALPIGALKALQSLDLSWNKLGAPGVRLLPLGELKALRNLDLAWNGLGSEGARDLPIAESSALRTLNLSWNNLGNPGACQLNLSKLPDLRGLNLSNNFMQDSGARGLALHHLRSLETLDLSCNEITDVGVRDLRLSQIRSLSLLNLSFNLIGPHLAHEFPFASLINLRTLDLSANHLGELGARVLPIANLQHLHTLNMCVNHLGNEGARLLLNVQLPGLRRLLLLGNGIDAEAMIRDIPVQRLSNLELLDLRKDGTLPIEVSDSTGDRPPGLRVLGLR